MYDQVLSTLSDRDRRLCSLVASSKPSRSNVIRHCRNVRGSPARRKQRLSVVMTQRQTFASPLPSLLPGAVLMLKGSVLRFGFLDCAGALIQSPYEIWRDPNAPEDPDRPRKRKLVHFSPSSSQDTSGDGHLAVVCSERQAKVFLMPSQACLFVHNITESSFVLRADVVTVYNSVCLACFCANGHVMTLRYRFLLPP